MRERTQVVGLAERAAKKICQAIYERKLKPGQVVSTESELAKEFGVSRNVIREAVGRLRAMGLVESRQCKGIIVAQSDPAKVMEQVVPNYVVDQATFADLVELRHAIEVGAVGLAIERRTEADMARLLELGRQFAEKSRQGAAEEADELDAEFHKLLLAMTRNELLMGMHYVITSSFFRSAAEMPDWNVALAQPAKADEHLEVAQAMAARDVERARRLLASHLSTYLWTRNPEQTAPKGFERP